MKKTNPIIIVVFVAVAVAILGYAYVIFGERYGFKKPAENINGNQDSTIEESGDYLGKNTEGNVNSNQNGNSNANENLNSNSNSDSSGPIEVGSKDCNNDCARFKANPDDLKYCQQVCGDVPVSRKNSAEDCANTSGREKDYCFKDLAVSKTDYAICNEIQDAKIKKLCKDRISEDLIDF